MRGTSLSEWWLGCPVPICGQDGGLAPTCLFSVWIPHPRLALQQKFLLCLVFVTVTFCVLFQPLKPRSQSRIPSCFRCQCVIDTLVTQRKSWTSHPHAGVLVLFGFLSCRMHIPNSIVGSRQLLCVPPRAETHRGQRPSELPWQDLCHLCCVPGSTPSPRITLFFLGTALPFSGPHSGAEITALLCLAPATLAPTSLEAAATCPQPSSVPVAGLEGAPLSLWGLV